jgi:hypothetical protein
MADAKQLPAGYRQGLITSITVVLTASILFFRFAVFEPSSGPWTRWGAASAVFAGASILLQLFTLWQSLQPDDEQIPVYTVTLRWFAVAILLLIVSLAADTVANVIY